MGNTTYKDLSDALFNKIKSYDFLQMTEELAYEVVETYIRPAIVNFDNCKQDLSDRDETLKEFNFKLSDDSFVILVNYMVIEWLTSNFILSQSSLKSTLSSSDFHSLNLSQMLSKSIELRSLLKNEADELSINKRYEDSSLFSIIVGKNGVR